MLYQYIITTHHITQIPDFVVDIIHARLLLLPSSICFLRQLQTYHVMLNLKRNLRLNPPSPRLSRPPLLTLHPRPKRLNTLLSHSVRSNKTQSHPWQLRWTPSPYLPNKTSFRIYLPALFKSLAVPPSRHSRRLKSSKYSRVRDPRQTLPCHRPRPNTL